MNKKMNTKRMSAIGGSAYGGKKQKKLNMFIGFVGLCSLLFLAQQVLAFGSARVSWIKPTTDEGGVALTGLTGYKIFWSTAAISCAAWNAGDQDYRLANPLSATAVNVTGADTTTYRFKTADGLTAGQAYHFAVVATDGTNLSKCATETGGATEVSKRVNYAGDINSSNGGSASKVDGQDVNLLKTYFGTTNSAGDIDGDGGTVDGADVNLMKADFLQQF